MLVMKRKIGQFILIGDNIRVTITAAGSGWAKIGVEAPREVIVDREEVSERRVLVKPAE